MMYKTAFVRRRTNEKFPQCSQFHTNCIVETVKHPIMIWSVICGQGVGRLYKVDGTMRQDGATCHIEKSVMAFLNILDRFLSK